MKLAFAAETVEDHSVERDGDDFDDDFNQGTDEGPVLQKGLSVNCYKVGIGEGSAYLKSADEIVVDFILEEGSALVVVAGPAPHVLTIAIGFACMENRRT